MVCPDELTARAPYINLVRTSSSRYKKTCAVPSSLFFLFQTPDCLLSSVWSFCCWQADAAFFPVRRAHNRPRKMKMPCLPVTPCRIPSLFVSSVRTSDKLQTVHLPLQMTRAGKEKQEKMMSPPMAFRMFLTMKSFLSCAPTACLNNSRPSLPTVCSDWNAGRALIAMWRSRSSIHSASMTEGLDTVWTGRVPPSKWFLILFPVCVIQ